LKAVCGLRCNTQQRVTRCNTLHHAAPRCNTLQHDATRCKAPGKGRGRPALQHAATHRRTLPHAATRCKTLQDTATNLVKTVGGLGTRGIAVYTTVNMPSAQSLSHTKREHTARELHLRDLGGRCVDFLALLVRMTVRNDR